MKIFSGIRRFFLTLLSRDRERREARPRDESSPLIVVRIPPARTYVAFFLIVAGFLGLAVRAFYLQVLNTDFLQRQGEYRYARTVSLASTRGEILDRNGVVLASSLPVRNIWADPAFTLKADKKDLQTLAKTLGMSYSSLRRKLEHPSSPHFVYLARRESVSTAETVRKLGIPGIGITPEVRRFYPDGPVLAHIVGFTDSENHGQEGVELAMDRTLRGEEGVRRVIRDRFGRVVDDVWAVEARPGQNVQLSIDSRIQFIAYDALNAAVKNAEAKAGAVIVADVRTGEILALVNSPAYDPNDKAGIKFDLVRNRSITDQFEPGSTMKPFAIAKALDMGIVTPMTTIQTAPGKLTIGDRTIGDIHDYGLLTVAEIVARSSNIGTVKIALEIAPQVLGDMYSKLGFGRPVSIGFPGATAGRLRPAKTWRPIEQATISYGHGVTVSLLQLVRAYTAIARDGDVIDLTLYKRPEGEVVKGEPVFKPETARSIRAMMMNTVRRGGTASIVKVAGYTVAGKTGTANKVKNGRYVDDTVASFVGIIPATRPRFVIAVMIDEPKRGMHYGGKAAGPVFNEVAAGALRTMMVSPDFDVAAQEALKEQKRGTRG